MSSSNDSNTKSIRSKPIGAIVCGAAMVKLVKLCQPEYAKSILATDGNKIIG